MMKIHLVGDEIAKGQGVGRGSVVGHAIVADSASDLEGKDLSDKVIITNSVDETLVPYVEKAIGLITEENGITSPSAIIGLEKGIPTVVGVEQATKEIKNDMLVTLDASQGKVFEGYVTSFNLTNDKLKRRFDNYKALKLFIREPGTLIYVPGFII